MWRELQQCFISMWVPSNENQVKTCLFFPISGSQTAAGCRDRFPYPYHIVATAGERGLVMGTIADHFFSVLLG